MLCELLGLDLAFGSVTSESESMLHSMSLSVTDIFLSLPGWPGKTSIKISYQALKFPTTLILLSHWELAFILCHFCASNVLIYQAPSFSFC